MKKLKLPVIQKSFPDTSRLFMDEYLKFVDLNLKYTFDRKTYRQWKRQQMVNVPFSLYRKKHNAKIK